MMEHGKPEGRNVGMAAERIGRRVDGRRNPAGQGWAALPPATLHLLSMALTDTIS
jgi:hypothetical protein